jgi:hypothetical protein
MNLFPNNKYYYKKENGIIYNLFNYYKLNYPNKIILTICFCIILSISKNKYSSIFTFIVLIAGSYFLHRYAPYLFGEYNPHKYHHDPNCANTWWGKTLEFLTNTVLLSGNIGLLLYNYIFKHSLFDPYIMLFYCIFYTSVHLYSYHVYDIETHKLHHLDERYNFGPEIFDIIFETKYDGGQIENYNYYISNIILATIVVIITYIYFK